MKPMLMRAGTSRQHGFTIVELVIVIVLMGILAGVAVPRFFDRRGFDAASYAEQLKAQLRFAQKTAIAGGRLVYVQVSSGGIVLAYDAAFSSYLLAPGKTNSGSSSTVALCGGDTTRACEGVPPGLTLSGALTFYFDANGQPFLTTNIPPTLTSTFATRTFTLAGDGGSRSVTVAAETGYVF